MATTVFSGSAYPSDVIMAYRRRDRLVIGLVLSLLVHGLVLWLHWNVPEVDKVAGPGETRLTISLTPAEKAAPAVPEPPAATPEPAPKQKPRPVPRKPVQTQTAQLIPMPSPIAVPPPQPEPTPLPPDNTPIPDAPVDSFMGQLQANRRRRELAENAAREANAANQPESDAQRANRIARANLAAQRRGQGFDDENSGGVFQLTELGYHHAEFIFRGWNVNVRRNWSQVIAVDQGGDPDIQTAVVKKIIEVIRQEKKGDFDWESHRLGRVVNLSARPEDTLGLTQFLLQEFFPDQPIPRHL